MTTMKIDESRMGVLRASDLIRFFEHAGRYSKCPHCDHDGTWDFHIKIDPETGKSDDDPVLIPFCIGMADKADGWTKCAGVTCPQCGHFSLISMYKIAAFKEGRDQRG
ncbi:MULTISPECIES: hypothetical protein [Pseudomonas]|uniref:hypothetical protein n=1 Tax=Pseudomonas TaxID=286 RepID=UPI0003D3B99F|nr:MULTISPECIES: hypothetical protein [Pseudomonas]ETD52472.1 hypothetical protein X922_09155 [Pseudomonas aeruginosa VRFPA08]KSS21629.1 hypothetical protein APB60_00350 [Pseudomonas aeruginosa]MBD1291381.1 hypothetical protein [Pseudomonas aeruginosa]MBG5510693.1 hypothetical protein [Pseudomonas aeruginosa]MBG7407709.1 hypothetical protein [Pseudomonas aeruginosa]